VFVADSNVVIVLCCIAKCGRIAYAVTACQIYNLSLFCAAVQLTDRLFYVALLT